MASPVAPFVARTRIAYFSMEIAVRQEMHTYAGGLGILAGDTARSCADLELPVVFVSLISRAGYFRQEIDGVGRQVEQPDWWEPAKWCTALDAMIAVEIESRPVWVRPWLYVHSCPHGSSIPILLLDTDLDQNSAEDRSLTNQLYGGGEVHRLKQEIVLGVAGVRLLRALGFVIETYHMNEGHAALLTLELLEQNRRTAAQEKSGEPVFDIAKVRDACVFTTHTPVEAGYDKFPYELFHRLYPMPIEPLALRRLAGHDKLNMTQLALNLSGYINGVARRHAETTSRMFPGYRVHAITNGVHVETWAHEAFARLFLEHFPNWCHEPEILVQVLQLSVDEIWRRHVMAKADLLTRVELSTGIALDPEVPIIGFARRMTGYKRPLLLFSDTERLVDIAACHSFQVVMAGKAHPHDSGGKEEIASLHQLKQQLQGKLTCVFLPNYDMAIAKTLVAGADVWLNTPLPPMEASGTSGMKAALNGVLNLSTLDGWWIEAAIEGVTGWSIGDDTIGAHESDAEDLYRKLSNIVLPLYYNEPARWRWMMQQAIGNIAYYFNSQRMMRRYAAEAYLR